MLYKFYDDVNVIVSDKKISFIKGIFNFSFSEITNDSEEFNDYFFLVNSIINKKRILKEDIKKYDLIINDLIKLNYIYNINEKNNSNFVLISNEIILNYFNKNKKIFGIKENLFKSKINILNYKSFNFDKNSFLMVISNGDSLNKLRELNKFIIKNNLKSCFFILDNNFIYIFKSDINGGCLECCFQRIISKMNLDIYKKFLEISNLDSNVCGTNSNISLIFSYFSYLSKNNFRNLKFLDSYFFSMFIPLLEVNITKFLKIPSCSVCGTYNNMRILKNYNNIDEIVEQIYNEKQEK